MEKKRPDQNKNAHPTADERTKEAYMRKLAQENPEAMANLLREFLKKLEDK
ncbi:hypothetical protein U6B65_00570 [Oscillospiraceae bacterium MB08-C2-2]|nr:hypothetical protein U6B65_00570 [Oscillospiraceae bacterium MB08-C2-2]